MGNNTVTILCSGFGLGFYTPGLIINYNLKKKQVDTEVLVFENYIVKDKKEHINDSKKAYHENFSVALIAQKLPRDMKQSIDENAVEELLLGWKKEDRCNFIVLSGHWVYILDRYCEMIKPKKVNVDLLYIDSELSPSWKSLKKYNPEYSSRYHEKWIVNAEKMEACFKIPVTERSPIPFRQRRNSIVIHGGGWGMGTYQSKIPELEEQSFSLDIVAYEQSEAKDQKPGNRYFMNDPSWSAWNRNENGEYGFPPLGEIKEGEKPVFTSKEEYHRWFDVTCEAKAIVSKPGGGTMIDSLSSGTPIVFLEPFGKHEKKNAELWEQLGFGIQYDKWRESGYSMDVLERLHENIIRAKDSIPDYVCDYIKNLTARGES
ncbi:glycosyltransferase family protein [Acetivibrio cellulolyticus]|uniref:hypothetical protein n=1 Tax=Acetivibrio cellulolyticus TaxID=35830 RepID=UPI0001E2E713|nr:hypothetical protein [Acetivibrio cellulolyticus]